ncbi:DUF1203 domain-containing protein [Sphingomonas jaspsi]|uniref:DUF1203 domain-containing protein n=1 Tax=Sphingomonas jaspsi TaxID=392409 RepID=UPI0005600123|nr:DUF1203 domain-containing protein [Sphingomonas jaspsi]
MTYRIRGLDPARFLPLFDLDEVELKRAETVRVTADADRGFPCRVSLEDARAGDTLVLTNYVSHDVATPYRTAYAIYVREGVAPADYVDQLPPVFAGRPLSLRGFGADGMLKEARLAAADAAEPAILDLLANDEVAYIDAHNAAHGCFAARIERYDSALV